MKKIILLLMSIFLSLALMGCEQPENTETVPVIYLEENGTELIEMEVDCSCSEPVCTREGYKCTESILLTEYCIKKLKEERAKRR